MLENDPYLWCDWRGIGHSSGSGMTGVEGGDSRIGTGKVPLLSAAVMVPVRIGG